MPVLHGHLGRLWVENRLLWSLASVVFASVRFVTLTPGDIFLTGTPPGVGVFRKPPIYLKVISQVQPANGKVLISVNL